VNHPVRFTGGHEWSSISRRPFGADGGRGLRKREGPDEDVSVLADPLVVMRGGVVVATSPRG